MLRYSYEWIEDSSDEDGAPHWTEQLYGIFDGKLGLAEDQAIAWAWDRDGAELIVGALNAAEERRQMAAAVWQLAQHRERFDLSDLLN